MGVKGVLEYVPKGSMVSVRVNDKTTVDAINSSFLKTDGTAMAGEQFWAPLQSLRAEKHIDLTAICAEKNDKTMKALILRVKDAAQRQLEELGENKALADAVAPKPKPVRKGVDFPPVEGDLSAYNPNPIRRKKIEDGY